MKKACISTEEIKHKLSEAGIQPTLQRIAICQYVLCEADHPTAEEVKDWAEKNLAQISQATVYNTLNTLVDAGLLRAFKLPHTDRVIYDCCTEDHFHFLDEKTGKLFDVAAEDIQINFKNGKKFKIKGFEVIIKGEVK